MVLTHCLSIKLVYQTKNIKFEKGLHTIFFTIAICI
jgi:hypothetical protein